MMKVSDLYNCPVKVEYKNLTDKLEAGHYLYQSDKIILCSQFKKDYPKSYSDVVYLHEMFHATGGLNRSLRQRRLANAFGKKRFHVEELIAEICTLIAMTKLGLSNEYTRSLVEMGIFENSVNGIYVPWREVQVALTKFIVEGKAFSQAELDDAKNYLRSNLKLDIRDTYMPNRILS